MYYFLAITLDSDVANGTFWPSYVLCKSWTDSEKRSGLRVIKQLDGKPTSKVPRLLVTDKTKHDDLIYFLSQYIAQDKMFGKHYFPKGYLCWYECNRHGEETGVVHIIKHVPTEEDWSIIYQSKLKKLAAYRARTPTLNEVLSNEEGIPVFEKKVILEQSYKTYRLTKERKPRNASGKKNNRRKRKRSGSAP